MRRFLFVLIFGVLGTGTLLWLGVWQTQRLTWKEAVLAQIDERIGAPPAALPASARPEADRYRPVAVTGRFLENTAYVLVSLRDVGAGYRVITAFETDTGRRILIDRGFVTAAEKHAPRPDWAGAVTGNLHWPRETDGFTPAPDLAGNIWFARDVPALGRALETEPLLIVARTGTGGAITPLPVQSAGIPNNHLQYAVTWFSLALIWAAMTGFFLWRSRGGTGR